MANAITYIRNVGKSIGYASFDVMKEMNPVFNDFAETNGQLVTDMYKSIRNLKKKSKSIPGQIMESEYGKFGKTYLDNLVSDIQSGKFYNKERKEKYDQEAANAMMGMDGMDDMDFGFDDSFDFDSMDSFDGEVSTNDMMDIVGEKTSNAISNTLARSAEYIVQGTTESNKAIYNQMNNIYGGLHTGLATINQNISKMIEFHNEGTTAHYQNSSTFYQEITRLDQERNQYLKEINETLKQLKGPEVKSTKTDYKKNTYSDMVTYEGVLDFSNYAQNIKKNLKDKSGGLYDMVNMMVETGMLNTLAASPLEGLAKLMVASVVPSAIEKSVENLNKSLSGMVGNALLTMKNKAKESSTWDTISEIFGVNTNLQTKLDPSKYEKGKVPFDGVTKKAIVEVIPTYLSKILSAVSGTPENRFNYDTGQFVTVDQLRKEFNDLTKTSANRAASGIDSVVRDKTRKLGWDEKQQKQFDEDWQAIKEYMFTKQKNFNTRDKNLRGNTFGLKGGMASDVNVRLLQTILDGNPEMLRYADQMFKEIDSHNRRMVDLQNSGNMTAIANGSISDDKSPVSGTSPTSIAASANNTILSELVSIHKELSFIRVYGTGKSSGKKGKGGSKVSFDNFKIPEPRVGNYNTYDKDVNKNATDHYDNLSDEELDKRTLDILNTGKESVKTESKKKSFSERMHEASTFSAKMSVLVQSASDLAKKPAEFVVAMMDKADARLYDLIYGPKEDKDGKKSFIGKLFKGLEKVFDRFSDFVTDKILEPLKEKFSGDKIKNFFKDSFEKIFKKSFDEVFGNIKKKLFGEKDEDGKRSEDSVFGKMINTFKSEMQGAKDWVKKSFKDVGDWSGVTSVKNEQGEAKQARNSKIDKEISKFQDILKRSVSNTTEAASGIKRVDNTGLAVISEGEMIIPPDMNPFNVSKRERGEKKVKDRLKAGIDSIFEFAKGTPKVEISDEQRAKNNATKARIASDKIKRLKSQKESFTREDFERLPFGSRVLEEGEKLIDTIRKSAKEIEISDDDKEKFKKKTTDFIGKIKDYGGTMAAGATIGAGVSLFTGLLGGPLVGAAVGAGIGLIKRSETVQNMLFGEMKDGERQGGLLSKELSNNIHKYLPDMARGATVGSILTALPIIPGGPVAGLIVGSALGFAKNNEAIQETLFGPGKFLGTKEEFQNKVKSALPKMGLGAIAGLLAGPFGLTTNVLLGSALGFASDTNKFKDLMFGEEVDGVRDGGIFGAVAKPAKEFFGNMYIELKDFVKTKMFQPIANAIDPVIKQFQIMASSITNMIAETLKNIFVRGVGSLARTIKEVIINPLAKMVQWAVSPLKALLSVPFKLVGAVGDSLRKRQIKRGQADYMSAQQRNAFRRSRGKLMGPGDKYSEFDQRLENMSAEDLDVLQNSLQGVKDSNKNTRSLHDRTYRVMYKEMYSSKNNVDTSTAKIALSMVRHGSYDEAIKLVRDHNNIDQAAKTRILTTLSKESAKLKIAEQMKSNSAEAKSKLADSFKKLGLDLPPETIDKLIKGDKEANKIFDLITTEKKYREKSQTSTDGKDITNVENKRHSEIIDHIKEITDLLKKQLNLESEVYKEDLSRQETHYDIMGGLKEDTEGAYDDLNEETTFGDKFRLAKYKFKKARKDVRKGISKGIKSVYNTGKQAVSNIRYSDPVTNLIGDGNNEWQPTIKVPDSLTDISNNIKKLLGVSVAQAKANGTDVPTDDRDVASNTYLDRIKTKFKNAKETITQIVDGIPMTLFRTKDGSYEQNLSDENTKKVNKLQEEKRQRETGILGALTSMPNMLGNLFGKIFGKKDEEEKSWFSKLLEKIGTPAKIAVAVAGAFGVMGWAKEKIFPALKSFWDEHAAPYLTEAWQGNKPGFGQFIYFFNPENPNGLSVRFKRFIDEDLPKIMQTASTYISSGMNWALRNVLPGVVSTLVQNLPTILTSVASGLLDGLNNLLFNKGKKNNGKMADVKLTSDPFSKMIPSSSPSWFDKNIDMGDTSPVQSNIVDVVSTSKTMARERLDSINQKASTGTTSKTQEYGIIDTTSASKTMARERLDAINQKTTTLPRAFDEMNPAYKTAALREYEKVKNNVVNTPYGEMTVAEVLNSDKQFTTNAETGEAIYGYDLLKYNNTAQELGMNIQLSEQEMKANTLAKGGGNRTTVQGVVGGAALRSFTRGLVGNTTGVKAGSKLIKGSLDLVGGAAKLLPGIGKPIGSAIQWTGKNVGNGLSGINKLGSKLTGKTAKEVAEEAAKETVQEVVENTAKNAKDGIFKKFAKSASGSKINKFINMACEAFKGMLKDSKVASLVADALSKFKGKVSKGTIKSGIDKFADKLVSKIPNVLKEYGAKLGLKSGAKLTAYLASATTLLVADAVISFISGYNNANSILGITQDPDLPYKVLCGIIEALNSVLLLGLVPLNVIVDLVVDNASLLGFDGLENLSKQRELAKEEVETYNKEYGTDFTVEEYNKRNSLGTKVKSALSTAGNWVSSLFKRDKETASKITVETPTYAASSYLKNKLNVPTSNVPSYAAASGRGSGLYVGRASNINRVISKSQDEQLRQNSDISRNTFISQIDSRYKDKQFNIAGDTEKQTLGDTGCAPAAAAMAINASFGADKATMEDSSRFALRYKVKNDGVNATYFNDEFARHGVNAQYITSTDAATRKREIINQLMQNNKVVLMGEDAANNSKLNSPFGPNAHYVVANGLSKDGKFIYINDPESKVPNIKYSTDKVLGSSKLGISANVARGSNISKIYNKLKRITGRGTYGSDTVQYKVWNKLRAAGYSEIQVAGLMGNIQHESGFDTSKIEKGSGIGFGLVQWSYGRRTQIESYASSIGKSASDLDVQLDFLLAEMTPGGGANGYAKYQFMKSSSEYDGTRWSADSFKNATDIESATKAFCFCFERPSAKYSHIDRRIQSAKEYYSAFTGTPITSISSSSSTSSSGSLISDIYGVFSGLAEAWGITKPTSSSDTSGTITGTASGNVSSNASFAEKQKALVNLMYSKEGQLKYSQQKRNPDNGSADCSSLVQWAYKNILGVDPGSWTGAQRTNPNTYTVATNSWTESDLQLGDLLLKQNPGHVEMYAGNGKMIGHGGGADGSVDGPTVSNLGKPSTYSLVRRWVGFKGSGSGLRDYIGKGSVAPVAAYDNALKHINPEQLTSLYPIGYDNEKFDKVSIMQYNNNKLSDVSIRRNNSPVYVGRASQVPIDVQNINKPNTDIIELVKIIINLLVKVVTNTDQLNNITKLLGEYISKAGSSDGSKESKEATLVAKQNLLNAIQSGGSNSSKPNAQLMALIEATEKIARE